MAQKTFILNDEVRCFSYGYTWSYAPLVTIQKNENQTVAQELVHDDYDWARYSVPMRTMTDDDKETLQNVIMNVGGNQDSFLFRDEFGLGNKIERNTIGSKPTASGISLQALRAYSITGETDRTYEVWNIELSLGFDLWVGGVLQTQGSDYTVNEIDDGTIDIISTDTGDVEIEGYFLRRCRFNGTMENIIEAFDLNNMQLTVVEESPFGV